MSGLPAPQPTAAGYPAPPAGKPPVRPLQLADVPPANRRDAERTDARARLLRFILENHRRRQLDAVRGLRSSGAE